MYRQLSQLYCATLDSAVNAKCRDLISAFPGRFRLRSIGNPSALPSAGSLNDWLILDSRILQEDGDRWIRLAQKFVGQIIWLSDGNTECPLGNRLPTQISLCDPNWTIQLLEATEPVDASISEPQISASIRRRRTTIDVPALTAVTPTFQPKAVLKIAADLNSLNRDRIHDVIMSELVPTFGATKASLYTYDAKQQALNLCRHTHPYPIDQVVSMRQTDRPMVAAVTDKTAIQVTGDWSRSPLSASVTRAFADQYASAGCAIIPIIDHAGDKELIGVLNLADRTGPVEGFVLARDMPMLAEWAELIARAFVNASQYERALRAAGTDELTGLGNYRNFHARLAEEAERGRRYGTPLSLIMLDVDNLKQVNDQYGHPGGDLLLKTIARRILEEIRHIDHAARLGGDEFAVLLPCTDLDAAKAVANRMHRSLRRRPVRWKGSMIQPAASLGVGQYQPGLSIRQFIHRVDQSLYTAKSSGRNCVATCDA